MAKALLGPFQKLLEVLFYTLPLLVELQAGTTTLEISLAVPQKAGNDTSRGTRYTTPGHKPRGFLGMQ